MFIEQWREYQLVMEMLNDATQSYDEKTMGYARGMKLGMEKAWKFMEQEQAKKNDLEAQKNNLRNSFKVSV